MHPLLRLLHDAATGRFPAPGSVDVFGPAPGPCDVVIALTATAPRVRVLTPREGGGVLLMGRGVAGRLEVALEVDPDRRAGSVGRRMLRAARRLATPDPLFAQVAPGNAPSHRTFLAARFVPLGTEVLFPRNPGP